MKILDKVLPISKKDMFTKLKERGWEAFYSELYWINEDKGYTEYSGVSPCEAYVREYYDLKGDDLFLAVTTLDYYQNKDKLLYIYSTAGTNTYNIKDILKQKYKAKWDPKAKKWYVNSSCIKNMDFHKDIGYCTLGWKDKNEQDY